MDHPLPLPQTHRQSPQSLHPLHPDPPRTRQTRLQTLLPPRRPRPRRPRRRHRGLRLFQDWNGRASGIPQWMICMQTQMLAILAPVNSNTHRIASTAQLTYLDQP